jgi:ribosomal-protein-alanine N-acetyltransferase
LQQEIEIRSAERRDINRILQIERACFGRDAWERDLFMEAFTNCPDLFYMAKIRGRIAGYSITCVEGGEAELISVAVFPCFQRRGVAQALIGATIAALMARGIQDLRLMVDVDNEPAIRLYKRLGFARIRTVPDYYRKGRSAWCMAVRLACSS